MAGMARAFVIHRHTGYGPEHFDMMLEHEGVLATWQFLASPLDIGQSGQLPATRIEDHRMAYLDYQGPISKGRGEVAMLERGTYLPLSVEAGRWELELQGRHLRGRFELDRQRPGGKEWVFKPLAGR